MTFASDICITVFPGRSTLTLQTLNTWCRIRSPQLFCNIKDTVVSQHYWPQRSGSVIIDVRRLSANVSQFAPGWLRLLPAQPQPQSHQRCHAKETAYSLSLRLSLSFSLSRMPWCLCPPSEPHIFCHRAALNGAGKILIIPTPAPFSTTRKFLI